MNILFTENGLSVKSLRGLFRNRLYEFEDIVKVENGNNVIKLTLIDGSSHKLRFGSKELASQASIRIEQAISRPGLNDEDRISPLNLDSALKDRLHSSGARAARTLDLLIHQGILNNASDLHLEPEGKTLVAKYRLDGNLYDVATIESPLAQKVMVKLKVDAGLVVFRNDIPQEGRLTVSARETDYDVRVSVMPTVRGEKAVLRIFGRGSMDLEELGFSRKLATSLKAALAGPEGLIAVTGPAGSGKSTSILACLKHIKEMVNPSSSIISIEDPVECKIEGVTQIEVKEDRGLTFEAVFRSTLRMDPNIIAIGEIRDPATATMALRASLSGHLVLTTVHAAKAAVVPLRLLEMGVEPYLVASSLTAILSQRLVRKVCSRCNGKKCEYCLETGFSGRVAVGEFLSLDEKLKDAILAKSPQNELLKLAEYSQGFVNFDEELEKLVKTGITTAEEAEKIKRGSKE